MKKMNSEEELEKYRKWIRNSQGMTENTKIEYKEFPNPQELLKMSEDVCDKVEAKEVGNKGEEGNLQASVK